MFHKFNKFPIQMKNRTEQDDGRIIEVQLDALPIFEVK
jgi:hypothetical protein